MQLAITKTATRRSASRSRQLKIRLKNNLRLLPVRALVLSSKYAAGSVRSCILKKNPRAEQAMERLNGSISGLKEMERILKEGNEMEPLDLYRGIRSSSALYVALFYSLYPAELERYMKLCASRNVGDKEKPEDSMLLFPAVLAQRGVPRGTATRKLALSLYNKPYGFLHRYSMEAIKIDLFEQSISVKNIPEAVLTYITEFMQSVRERIAAQEKAELRPVADENMTTEFINKIVDFSAEGSSCLAPYMEERLDNTRTYPRLIRI
jgi:hypothetical protein